MIVHFGIHLDGMQPGRPATEIGIVTAGPMRLLDMLELQLGLPPVSARPGEALLAYQACLEAFDDLTRFYHRSFGVDAIGVARTLLDWRAQWYESGWRGEFSGPVSPRLADMAAVEQLARERVPFTAGQRLERIGRALDEGLATQIERLVLHDEPDALPRAWRRLLERFDSTRTDGVRPSSRAAAGTDLERVQRVLLALADHEEGTAPERVALAGDDTFVVVRAVSRDLSAQAIAEWLRRTSLPDDTVVIAERDGIIVDNALERVGLPRAGFQHYSRFRAVTQVLKLCLGLVWEPLSPQLLLQFLLHPVGPLPRGARSVLAEAVAAEPGVGGRAWRHAVERIVERERAKDGPEPADGSGAADGADTLPPGNTRAERLLNDIRFWLEAPRHAPGSGAPPAVLIERAQRCTTWLAQRMHGAADAERDLYAAAQAQGEALIEALASLAERGENRVRRIMLEQLVDEVTGQAPDPATFAQAGHVRAATEPAAITQAWRKVVWWDLAAPPLGAAQPWSRSEVAELAEAGAALPSAEQRIRARSRAWQRPILNAREQLILVVHDREEGHHPLWSRLTSIVSGFTEVRIEDELLTGRQRAAIPALEVATEPLPVRPLPAPRRWWQLPPDCRLAPRAAESYSSLDKLIKYPHEWVLTYPARLTTGRAANLPSLALLRGNLAHRVLEEFFTAFPAGGTPGWADLDEAELRQWLAHTLLPIVEREAAMLAEPGMGVMRERIAATIDAALRLLVGHLKSAGIVHVAPEQQHDVPFDGIAPRADGGVPVRLRGSIDLLLTDARGRDVVLDVKWGGEEWRGRELAENSALQLAIYAYMRRAAVRGTGVPPTSTTAACSSAAPGQAPMPSAWPEQAYFIVSTGNIVARDTNVFPEAIEFPPQDGVDAERYWRRLCASFDWRWSQLAAGTIEVNAEGTEADELCVPPDDALPAAGGPNNFADFTWLTGWERGE